VVVGEVENIVDLVFLNEIGGNPYLKQKICVLTLARYVNHLFSASFIRTESKFS
jgi:hypothetical protein